jgi:hypothetical protein
MVGKMTNLLPRTVLATLPTRHEAPIPPQDIFRRLGVKSPSASQRRSLSLALERLETLELAERWNGWQGRRGKGYLWRRTNP